MWAIVAGVSGNTRLKAKYKPEKRGSTSEQVTENKTMIGTCTPLPPPHPPLYAPASLWRDWQWNAVVTGVLLFLAAIPVSLYEPQSAFVFQAAGGWNCGSLWLANGSRVLKFTRRALLTPGVRRAVIVTHLQLNFDCGTVLRQLSCLWLRTFAAVELFFRFMHSGFNDKRTEKVAGLTPRGLEEFLCAVFSVLLVLCLEFSSFCNRHWFLLG